jgi:hypothetical protein
MELSPVSLTFAPQKTKMVYGGVGGEVIMKKAVIAFLALACLAVVAPRDLPAQVGVKIGASFAKFNWTTPEPTGVAWGYLPFVAGGLFANVNLGALAIEPELLVVRAGARYAAEGDSLEFQFTYIQAPVLLKLSASPRGSVNPFLAVGGYGAYLYRAQGVLVHAPGTERTTADLIDDYKRSDFGVVASAGLEFRLRGVIISLEGRYDLGLVNIIKNPAAGESLMNRSLMALVGIGF